MHNTELNFEDMKHGIDKAGGLFYQYRPCRRDVATIYDIENIRHGVVYAQTPLNMNDPFDSMIGYSPEKMYENCISMLVEELNIEDESFKFIISQFLKYKAVGKLAEFICMLNDLKKYLFSRQVSMHQVNVPIIIFIRQNLNTLYAKCPKKIKGVLSKEVFAAFLLIVSDMESVNITEDNLADMLKLDNVLDELYEKAVDIKDNVYIPTLRTFLSKLTVSCFSVSGWDNQLMWSHYANSYAGICIEYDFNQIKDEHLMGHWICEMAEMLAVLNTKYNEATKAFLSKQYDNYRKPYGTRAEDIPRQCVFAGTSNVINFLPLDRSGNRRFLPIMCDSSKAEVHILENEAESRAYIEQMWAEMMALYGDGKIRLKLPKEIEKNLIEYQRPFMQEDTWTGLIQEWLDHTSNQVVCVQQIYNEALKEIGKPRNSEAREIGQIMNGTVSGWKAYPNPRNIPGYGKQRGWMRVETKSGNSDETFVSVDATQMEIPFDIEK